MGSIGGMELLGWIELLLTHRKYEPLPDSDDEYPDDSQDEEAAELEYESDSDAELEYESDSDAEGPQKRRRVMDPRRTKRRRLNDDDDDVCVINAEQIH